MSFATAKTRARTVRRQLRDSGLVFTVAQFRDAVTAACADLGASALEGLVQAAVKQVDKEAIDERPCHHQGELFVNLQGDYAIDAGRRIGRRHARIEHMEAAMRLHDANLAAQQAANDAIHQEYQLLLPYYGPGVPKEQAYQAYLEQNPVPAEST